MMEESSSKRPRSRSRSSSMGEYVGSPPQRASRRLAGQRPEVEVIKRSRGFSSSPPPSAELMSGDNSYMDCIDIVSNPDENETNVNTIYEELGVGFHDHLSRDNPFMKEEAYVEILEGPYLASSAPTESTFRGNEIFKAEPLPAFPAAPTPSHTQITKPPLIDEQWNTLLRARGIKRVTLTVSNSDSMQIDDDELLVDSYPLDGDRKRKSKNGKKKSSKRSAQPIVEEEIVFTEEDELEKQLRERNNELEALQQLSSTLGRMSSMRKSEIEAPISAALGRAISDFFDEVITDIIQEAHFCIVVHPETSLNQAVPSNGLDIFGQDPATTRHDSFFCGNACGRLISSNRYAPHLEKCTGLQGMKAKPSRRSNYDRD